MNEPGWAEVLETIYSNEPDTPKGKINEDHPFVTDTNLNRESAIAAIRSLKKWDLVEEESASVKGDVGKEQTGRIPRSEVQYRLTTDGFEVAHDREQSKEQSKNNQAIVLLTLALAFVAIVDTSINAAIGAGYNTPHLIVFSLIAIGFFTALAVFMSRRDMLPK